MRRSVAQSLPAISPGKPFAGAEPGATLHRMGNLVVIVGHSHYGWHLSISHPTRYPTWDEVAHARYALIPDGVTMAMLLPPQAEYVNLSAYCLHLWQIGGDA